MDFKQQLNEKTEYINNIIDAYLPEVEGMQEKVIEAAVYSVDAGGKRIRPMLIMEVYKLCGGTDMEVIKPFMAAIECIHTYSLVHDDLPAMDNDAYRRGKLTTHKKFGEDFGILAGDALLNYAYEIIFNALNEAVINNSQYKNNMIKAAAVLSKKAGIYGMVGGQAVDVLLTDKKISEKQLDFIFNLKTAALIEASFMTGAILAGADETTVKNMELAGNRVGMAFQIQDDVLDVIGDEKVIGKPVLSDEKNNKTTYVTLFGIDKALNDVKILSEEAVDIVKNAGHNEFLLELIEKLINRKK